MARLLQFLALALTVSVAASSSAEDRVTFDVQVAAVFRESCLACHNAEQKKGGLDLSSYSGVSAGSSSGNIVEAGNPDASRLMLVLSHKQQPFMPPNKPKLSDDKLATVRQWIEQGLLENAGSKPKLTKPRVDLTLAAAPTGKPAEPIPLPTEGLEEPVVVAPRLTAVTALDHNPWAPLVALGGQKQILLYRSDELRLAGILPFPDGFANVLRFTRNGRYLLAAGGLGAQSGRAVLFDFVTGRRVAAVGDEYDAILAADITPEQSIIALGGPDRLVKGYRVAGGEVVYTIKKHTEWVTSLGFSPDGVLLASGDRNGGLLVSEAANGGLFYDLRGHTGAITAVSFRSDSNVLASASEDGTIRLWNMQDGAAIKNWGHGAAVTDVRYTHDGRIVSTGRDQRLKIWDGEGKLLREFEPFPDLALRGTFNHDGTRAIGADWTGQVRVFNTADGARVGDLNVNPPALGPQLAQAEQLAATSRAKLPEWQAGLAAAKQLIEKTPGEIAGLKQRQTELETAAVKTAEAEQAAAKAAHEKTIAERGAAIARLDEARKASGTAQQAGADAEKEATTKEQAALSAAATLDAATKKLEAFRGELAGLPKRIADAEAAVASAMQQATQLEQQIAEHAVVETKVKRLKSAVTFTPVFYGRLEFDDAQAAHEAKLAEVDAARSVHQARLATIENLKKEMVDGPGLIAMREQAAAAAKSEVAAAQAAVEAAQAALAPLTAKATADNGVLQMKTTEIQAKLEALNKANADVAAKLAAVQKAEADAAGLLAAAQKTQADIGAKQTAADVVARVVADRQAELDKATVDARAKETELAAARTALQPKLDELAKKRADLTVLEQAVAKSRADTKVRLEVVTRSQADRQSKTDALELQSLNELLAKLEADHKIFAEQTTKLEADHRGLAEATQKLGVDVRPGQEQVARLAAEHDGLAKRVAALSGELPQMQAATALLTNELAGMRQHVVNLDAQRNGLVEPTKKFQAEHQAAVAAAVPLAAEHQQAVEAAAAAKTATDASAQLAAAGQMQVDARRTSLAETQAKTVAAEQSVAAAKAAVESAPQRLAAAEASAKQAAEEIAVAQNGATQSDARLQAVKKKLEQLTSAWSATKG